MADHPTYTRELADWICEQLKKDRPLIDICSAPNMPSASTVRLWAREDHDGFAERYKAAQRHRGPSTEYTREIGDRICAELRKGRMVKDICQDEGMPGARTIRKWAARNRRDDFGARYRELCQVTYPEEVGEHICRELEKGRLLSDICAEPGMPAVGTVRRWSRLDRNGFAARFNEARDLGFHMMAEDVVRICNDRTGDWSERPAKDGRTELVFNPGNVARSRLMADGLRWLLSKSAPRHYGDKVDARTAQEAAPEQDDRLSRLMKVIDGRTRAISAD